MLKLMVSIPETFLSAGASWDAMQWVPVTRAQVAYSDWGYAFFLGFQGVCAISK